MTECKEGDKKTCNVCTRERGGGKHQEKEREGENGSGWEGEKKRKRVNRVKTCWCKRSSLVSLPERSFSIHGGLPLQPVVEVIIHFSLVIYN